MKAKKKALVFIALLVLSLSLWKLLLGFGKEVSAKASFGYDGEGKFIAFSFDKPVKIERIHIGPEEFTIAEEVGQGYTFRYNWEPEKDYSIRLVFEKGNALIQSKDPSQESMLESSASFYRARFGEEEVAVAEVNIFSIENEVVKAYFAQAGESLGKVTILKYPPVFTPLKKYEEFCKKLEEELEKLGIRVEKTRKVEEAEGLIIVAGGAWPENLNRSDDILYIGTAPGNVLVREDGSLAIGETWDEIIASPSEVDSELNFKSSAYTAKPSKKAVASREDGLPGIFRVGNTLIFSNTLDRGWEDIDGAVEDVVEAVISWGFRPSMKREFKLDGDAKNYTVLLYSRQDEKVEYWGLTVASENSGGVTVKGLEGGGAKIDGPRHAYPGDDVEFNAYIPGGHMAVKVEISGEKAVGWGEIEGVSTKGLDVRRIRASFPEPGAYLVKLLEGDYILGSALVHVKHIEVEGEYVKAGTRGEIHIKVLEDGEPYTGEAGLYIDGEVVLQAEVVNGILRYKGNIPKTGEVEVAIHNKRYPVAMPTKKGVLPGWMRPYHIALFILLAASAAFSILVRGKDSRMVVIEIPEAWDRDEIRAKASEVIRVFDLYNSRMRWEMLPLTIEEVQRALYLFGVAKDYPDRGSVARLLDKDMNKKTPSAARSVTGELCVVEAYGYYAPYKWNTEYQSIEHLAMIRVAYEWLIKGGIEAKPLTLRSYSLKNYPDVLGVADIKTLVSLLGGPAVGEEVMLMVECETGKKHGKDAVDKLTKAFEKKLLLVSKMGPEVKEAMLFVLSEELYSAYEKLIRESPDEHKHLVKKIKAYSAGKILFVKSIEEIL